MNHNQFNRHKILLSFVLVALVITSGFILLLFNLSSKQRYDFPYYSIDSDVQGIVTVAASVPLDEDGDGMPNNWENQYGLNPADPSDADDDGDGDNLINLLEYQNGTDPTNPDTDGGGSNDGQEVLSNCSNPLNPLDDGLFLCPICGDGVIVPPEECDDNNTANGDGCSSTCNVEYCGDGVVNNNGLEECDGTAGVGLHETCSLACEIISLTYCGDGFVQSPNDEGGYEQCEIPDSQNEACTDSLGYSGVKNRSCVSTCSWGSFGSCSTSEYCSDGLINGNEQCDDGNLAGGDGCSNTCAFEPVCGNGQLESGEQCDDGNTNNGDNCSSTCVNEKICGDGELEYPEECDDGNTVSGDNCSNTCKLEFRCGNGIKEGSEQCDDGNTNNGDGCSSICIKEGGINDSDNDGLPDWWEIRFDFPPGQDGANDDPDGDLVTNIEEYNHKTNPLNPDTDGDKLKDGEEIYNYKTSPILKDTDRDGLSDYDEIYLYKTNPNKFDTDGGGIGDGDEVVNKTDPLDPTDDAKITSELFLSQNEQIKVKDEDGIYRILDNLDYTFVLHALGDIKAIYLEYNGERYPLIKLNEGDEFKTLMQIHELGSHRGIVKIEYKTGYSIQYSRYFYVYPNGTVQNGRTGNPVNKAKVKLYKLNNGNWELYSYKASIISNPQQTDIAGEYKFFVEAGQYRLEISKLGYKTYESDIYEFEDSGYINDTFFILPVVTLSSMPKAFNDLVNLFERFGSKLLFGILFLLLMLIATLIYLFVFRRSKIVGYVFDMNKNVPIPGVKLKFENKKKIFTTDAKGRFALRTNRIFGEVVIKVVTEDVKPVYNLGDNKTIDNELYSAYTLGTKLKKDKLVQRVIIYIM